LRLTHPTGDKNATLGFKNPKRDRGFESGVLEVIRGGLGVLTHPSGTDGSNPASSSGEFAGMFEPPAYARSRPDLHRQVAAAASRAAGIS